MIFAIGCSSDNQISNDLSFLDVKRNYPEKEFVLTDVADITFSHLNAKNKDFIFKNPFGESIHSFTKNKIIVFDVLYGNVLFFSRDGNPQSRFNRVGQGPEEYLSNLNELLYDEETDDVYISSVFSNFIQVYSSGGEYRRKLTLPEGITLTQVVSFDEQSLLVYNDRMHLNMIKNFLGEDPTTYAGSHNDSTYILISKTDGKVLDYIKMPSGTINVSNITEIHPKTGEKIFGTRPIARILKCADGLLLSNPETDTIFFCGKDKSLTPIIHKTPLVKDLDPMIVLENCIDLGSYQLLSTFSLNPDDKVKKTYIRDKKTSEIFRPKVVLPDYKGKELLFVLRKNRFHEKEYYFELDLIELKQAYRENKLSGKLKEFVDTLDEDKDNNVLMFVNFKE